MAVVGLREHKWDRQTFWPLSEVCRRGHQVNRSSRGGAVQTQQFLSGLHCCRAILVRYECEQSFSAVSLTERPKFGIFESWSRVDGREFVMLRKQGVQD